MPGVSPTLVEDVYWCGKARGFLIKIGAGVRRDKLLVPSIGRNSVFPRDRTPITQNQPSRFVYAQRIQLHFSRKMCWERRAAGKDLKIHQFGASCHEHRPAFASIKAITVITEQKTPLQVIK